MIVNDYTALLSGYYWNDLNLSGKSAILTYSFSQTASPGNYDPASNPFTGSIETARQGIVKQALDMWASVSGITFLEVDAHLGDLQIGYYDISGPFSGDATYPTTGTYQVGADLLTYSGTGETAGVVRLDPYELYTDQWFLAVTLHEIGHALGLAHPHDGDLILNPILDTGANTVMTYNDAPMTLGTMDIQAIQAIYGGPGTVHPFNWSWNAVTETLYQTGTFNSEYIRGTRAADYIDTAGGKDTIVTLDGNDVVVAHGQASEMNLGNGLDTVINNTRYTDVTNFYLDEAHDFAVFNTGLGQQTLLNVERVQFSDGTLAFDDKGVAGQAYRLYKAAFDRTPDTPGLGHWVRYLDSNPSDLFSVSNEFIKSPEFSSLYGAPGTVSNDIFITLLYKNVLDRTPDTGGYNAWNSNLQGNMSRAEVLAHFSESAENVAAVAPLIDDGIFFT